MSWTPILTDQPISYVRNNSCYRNSARETLAGGTPVYYVPDDVDTSYTSGHNGPKYKYGYTYDNCPYPENTWFGNCTWWCWGRLLETQGIRLYYMGNGNSWYNSYSGTKERNPTYINPGDIICFSGGANGHVMFVEKVDSTTVYISQSAYSQRSLWDGYACRVTSFSISDIYQGNQIDMYDGISSSSYYVTVDGVIHTGSVSPDPPTPPTPSTLDPEIIVTCMLNGKKKKMRIIIE